MPVLLVPVVLGLCISICAHPQSLASLIVNVSYDASSPISSGAIATTKLPRVSPLANSISAWPGFFVPFSAYDGVVGSQQLFWRHVWPSCPATTDKQHALIRFSARASVVGSRQPYWRHVWPSFPAAAVLSRFSARAGVIACSGTLPKEAGGQDPSW